MHNHILEEKIGKTILKLSWPMIVAFLLQTSFNIIDAIYVGMISAEALAAVSMAFPVVFLMISLASGLGVGATSIIARSIGAKNYQKANNTAEHAIIMAGLLAIVFTTCGLLFGKPLFQLMGAEGSLLKLVVQYANIIFIGSIFMFLAFIANNILRGEGNMKVPMYVMGGSAILNIILDPIFIFVLGWGVQGAAIATILARFTGFLFAFTYILKGKAVIKLSLRYFKYKFKIVKELFYIGFPSSISQVLISVSMFILMTIVAKFGTAGIAAYGIAFRLDSVGFMPVIGMMTAIMTIVGQNIGAGNFARARRTTFIASLIAIAYSLVIGILFFSLAVPLAKLFNSDPQVIYYSSIYLLINAFTYIFIAVGMIIMGSFLGAGRPMPPLIINLLRLVVIAVPLAYYLSTIYGLIGVWIGIAIASVVSGIVSIIWFRFSNFEKK
ncbi:MAG: MATE family efflux transporter [Nanoarchaeota archaeon]|nr:MATE family efflux transporter [Nanoarchaeota archaeon]MBU1622735.1 MATE family efflux transporter [Nanoarchaeota archaeon]